MNNIILSSENHLKRNHLNRLMSTPEKERQARNRRERYLRDREKAIEQATRYRQEHYETVNQQIQCECGGHYVHRAKARHLRTTKHQHFVNSQ